MPIPKEFLQESCQDAIQDCEELLWLMDDNKEKLSALRRILQKEKSFIPSLILDGCAVHTHKIDEQLQTGVNEISLLKDSLIAQKESGELLIFASKKKQEWGMFVRGIQGVIGSLMSSLDWQSPSYDSSLLPQAGAQRGKIDATINDYKRDHHLDAEQYERAFVREYIDTALKPFVRLYATASGMAAFTTALNFLLMEKKIAGPVFVGANVYFENKELLEKSLGSFLHEVDEFDTSGILKKIEIYSPRALFFDTMANTETLAMPALERIIAYLAKSAKKDTYLILDNTCAGIFFQPMKKFLYKPRHIHFLVIESLNKFHQFGMDRVTGGVVWGYGKDVGKLFDYRMHLGTNIPDASLHALPTPNRNLLARRMARLSRNAMLLAKELSEYISRARICQVEQIMYPGLLAHPCHDLASERGFYGSFFALRFREKYRTIHHYKKFITGAIRAARIQNVSLVAGTSFGFSTTRVYMTALRASATEPFVRISAGTETLLEVKKISEILQKAVRAF